MKRLEVLHYDKDFSQVKAMPFKLEKENFPLDELLKVIRILHQSILNPLIPNLLMAPKEPFYLIL